ncbi:putative ATPase YjoB [Grifola frondosa]|uniref:Putative ATPase YjoB n=1 Tax=Grifola frondosa TaxID=5627 RepID=A0A1C7MKH7_GRIFR|nr:putative ATPase YjoB [Grifola frondosa]
MSQQHTGQSLKELEDAFIKVTFEEDIGSEAPHSETNDPFSVPWFEQASAKFSDPAIFGAKYLRNLYPKHSVVLSNDYNISLLSYPGAIIQPLFPSDLITNVYFIPLARHLSQIPGVLVDQIKFGSFRLAWDKYDFVLYIVKYPQGFGEIIQHFILHEGPEEHARGLLIAAGAWHDQLHDEILVFNQGRWYKDHNLWTEVQKANWDDVILKDEFKTSLKKDVFGFFDSEELYKSLFIPWKRGLIMYGPPGNGKTISMKAIMKDSDAKGYAPLYAKEAAMALVFDKARQMAPCVVILEDLDSLINDRNRSFFLNQLDGLEGNDGLLLIGSTNHFDRLDPALNSRPSRFDRKFLFDDPDRDERALYVKYWQGKLKNNKSISFPDSLVEEVADSTDKFSFAYLKEAFVATLVLLAGEEGEKKSEFPVVLKAQIKALRNQLDKGKDINSVRMSRVPGSFCVNATPVTQPVDRRIMQVDKRTVGQERIWDAGAFGGGRTSGDIPGPQPQKAEGRRDVRSMALAAATLGRRAFIS